MGVSHFFSFPVSLCCFVYLVLFAFKLCTTLRVAKSVKCIINKRLYTYYLTTDCHWTSLFLHTAHQQNKCKKAQKSRVALWTHRTLTPPAAAAAACVQERTYIVSQLEVFLARQLIVHSFDQLQDLQGMGRGRGRERMSFECCWTVGAPTERQRSVAAQRASSRRWGGQELWDLATLRTLNGTLATVWDDRWADCYGGGERLGRGPSFISFTLLGRSDNAIPPISCTVHATRHTHPNGHIHPETNLWKNLAHLLVYINSYPLLLYIWRLPPASHCSKDTQHISDAPAATSSRNSVAFFNGISK